MCYRMFTVVSGWVVSKAGPSPSPYFVSVQETFLSGLMGGFGVRLTALSLHHPLSPTVNPSLCNCYPCRLSSHAHTLALQMVKMQIRPKSVVCNVACIRLAHAVSQYL